MNNDFITSNCIILKKMPYKESSLIVSALSPEFGKIDFLIKGALKFKNKSLPVIDLFRVIEVKIKNIHKKSLHSIYSASLITAFDDIPLSMDNYNHACDISQFLLYNSHPYVPVPKTFIASLSAFDSLSRIKNDPTPWVMLVKLVFLYENGFLPEMPDDDSGRMKLLQTLLRTPLKGAVFPQLTISYIANLNNWLNSICKIHDLRI